MKVDLSRMWGAIGLLILVIGVSLSTGVALFMTLLVETVAADERTVRIGVLAFRGKEVCLRRWADTAKFLSDRIPSKRFEIVPLTLTEMSEKTRRGSIDFVITNTGNYVELEALFGISRIATLRKPESFTTGNVFGAVIFTRADRNDISTLRDLRGKRFMAVERNGFGGFQMAWRRLKASGLDPFTDFSELKFSGFPQDLVALAVLDGRVDAGTFRTGTLSAMAAEGKIKRSDFRVIEPIDHEGFPYSASTKLYPEWPFARLKSTSDSLSQKVVIALLGMPPDSAAARAANYAGWVVPLDYQPVHELFQELEIGPYADLGKVTIAKVFSQYKLWIFLAVVLILSSLAWTVWIEYMVKRRTRELSFANEQLARQITEREFAEQTAVERQNELARVSRLNAMGEMASGLAHQLNHPLATIANYSRGSIRRLRSGKAENAEILEALEHVTEQADHAADIVASINNFIRKEQRQRTLVDVNVMVREAISLLEFDASRHEVNVKLDLDEKLPMVLADPVQLEQAVFNLARNSIDAMADKIARKKLLTIATCREPPGSVSVRVRDTGPGFSEKVKDVALDPFVTTKTEGLGMGLAISRTIIESHGGTIKVHESGPGGSEIGIVLPEAEMV